MNRRHHPLDLEEQALARLLAEAGDDGPSPELDARILAAARAAQPASAPGAVLPRSGAGGTRRPRRRLPLAIGLAASVTLAVGVAWQLREPPRAELAAADAALPATADTFQAPPAKGRVAETAQAAADVEATGAVPSTQAGAAPSGSGQVIPPLPLPPQAMRQRPEQPLADADRQRRHESASVATGAAATERAAAPPARRAQAAAAAAAVRELAGPPPRDQTPPPVAQSSVPPPPPPPPPATAPAPAPAPAAPAPAVAAPAMVQGAPAEREQQRRTRSQAVAEPAPPSAFIDRTAAPSRDDTAASLEDDARLPIAQWLQRIRERQAHGELELARASLARLVETHPALSIPEDLQPLLP